jgi:hypothetical protein
MTKSKLQKEYVKHLAIILTEKSGFKFSAKMTRECMLIAGCYASGLVKKEKVKR